MIKCENCWKTIKDKLPGDFLESAFVDVKDRGRLKCSTPCITYHPLPVLHTFGSRTNS